ncbi:hypothetical protein [uncultured Methanobrevibacter sp.]|uniref:hypothetical protein n=1 Tax=uncultured Methanobrevibacter sp. TaxID=253161 RepID=UPI0025E3BC62|nr:hypothetical protein [uncultured Methanobrevibacter sp.]
MKKPLITILMIIFAVTTCMNFVSAENETNIFKSSESEEEVLAREDGHVNITFDNGYNGYCINYGEHEAKTGQEYSVQDTTYATNKNSGESVGNYLKVYFVDYYDDAMRNDIVTQHTIWHFTDDFNGWRIDPILIENIKSTASTKTIPDNGAVRQINNTTEAVFDFQVLSSDKSEHQNFFAYKITYRDIVREIIGNATSSNSTASENQNITNATENTTSTDKHENNASSIENTTSKEEQKNIAEPAEGSGKTAADNARKVSKENNTKSINLSKQVTGKRTLGIILLLIALVTIAAINVRRD